MEVTVEEVIEKKGVVTKDYIGNLPTKMDEVMGELKAMREEVAIQTHQVADHDDRLEKIESHVGISSN